MAKKKNQTRKNKSEPSRKQRKTAATRKTASRKMRAAPKVKAKGQNLKTSPNPQPQHKSASTNRSEGIRLFKLAGRPTREQIIRVPGPAGPKMTWQQRAAAGIPAEKFRAALAAKQSGR